MYKETTRPKFWVADLKKELPDIMKKTVISPLHYGETIELCFVRGVEGETFINGKHFEYEYKNVFFIPPKCLHTSNYRKGGSKKNDMICAVHINIDALSPFVDIKKILLKDNKTVFDLAYRCKNFDMIWEIAQSLLDENRTFLSRVINTLKLFELISTEKKSNSAKIEYGKIADEMIDYVEKNFNKKISLTSASQYFGYSNQYFCKWCKKQTGVSFSEFVNAVRITHARGLLLGGYLVEEVSDKCGFSDPSYFSKVFKKHVGITPKAYALKTLSEQK